MRGGKVYLGDSVYVEVEHGMLKLTTENGYGASNTVYLEPEVFEALANYYAAVRRRNPTVSEQEENIT